MASDQKLDQDNLNDRKNPDNVDSPDNARATNNFTGFTMVAPNATRRQQLQISAQKGEEVLQKWKESHRAVSIDEPPERLGGHVSLAEARQKQQVQSSQARLQKRLKKEDMERRRREEEEEENQRMKNEQREKAERQKERTRQQEQRRSQQLRPEHLRATDVFLQNLQCEGSLPASSSSRSQTHSLTGLTCLSSPPHAFPGESKFKGLPRRGGGEENEWWRGEESSGLHPKKTEQTRPVPRSQTLRDDPREREVGSGRELEDHRMLEGRGRAGDASAAGGSKESRESRRSEPPQRIPGPPQGDAGWPELATEIEPEYEWAVTKLEAAFPECSRIFLEDILTQCDGDYRQAVALLSETMS